MESLRILGAMTISTSFFLNLYPVAGISCNLGRSCNDPISEVDLIRGSSNEIHDKCMRHLGCKAIEYNIKEKHGRLCKSTSHIASSTWQVCVITGIYFFSSVVPNCFQSKDVWYKNRVTTCFSLTFQGCSHCAAGTGYTCSADKMSSIDCEVLFESSCKVDGFKVPFKQTQANGCKNCRDPSGIRSVCATSCNYCDIQRQASSTTRASKSG